MNKLNISVAPLREKAKSGKPSWYPPLTEEFIKELDRSGVLCRKEVVSKDLVVTAQSTRGFDIVLPALRILGDPSITLLSATLASALGTFIAAIMKRKLLKPEQASIKLEIHMSGYNKPFLFSESASKLAASVSNFVSKLPTQAKDNFGQKFDYWCKVYDPLELELCYIRKLLGPPPKRVLDIGAGTGRIAIPLAREGYKVIALDSDRRLLDVLSFKAMSQNIPSENLEIIECKWPYLRESLSVDAVIFAWTLICLPNPTKALLYAKRFLSNSSNPIIIFVEPWGGGDYSQVVKPFLKEIPEIDPNNSYLSPISKALPEWVLHDYGTHEIPYVFDSFTSLVSTFEFALSKWHRIPISDEMRKSLKRRLISYKRNSKYIVFEAPRFFYVLPR